MENCRYSVALRYDPGNLKINQKVILCLSRFDPTISRRLSDLTGMKRLIIQKNIDLAAAQKLKQLLDKTGAACEVHQYPPKPSDGPEIDPRKDNSVRPGVEPSTPIWVQCPNCGFQQPSAEPECRSCGIIIAKAKSRRKAAVAPSPTEKSAPSQPPPAHPFMDKLHQHAQPFFKLLMIIQHPIQKEKLNTWLMRVGDRAIQCGLVFVIAMIFEIGLLFLGSMLWFIYISTPVGQYYLNHMPEKAEQIQSVINAEALSLAWDITLTAFFAALAVGAVTQFLHIRRYLYESMGIIGKLVLWFAPVTGVSAWLISQQDPFPVFPLACILTAIPVLCLLPGCLRLARQVLPEVGDFGHLFSLLFREKEKNWYNISKKFRSWLDHFKELH